MTLYELAENITIQGNVEIAKFKGGEVDSWFTFGTIDLGIDINELESEGIGNLEVRYIYSDATKDGESYVVIEVVEEEE